MKQTIKLDVDGVLRDCISPLLKLYNTKYNQNVKHEDISEWNINKFIPLNPHYKDYFNNHAEEIFRNSPIYNPDIPFQIHNLHNKFNIHIVTSQYKGLEKHTAHWLNENGIE